MATVLLLLVLFFAELPGSDSVKTFTKLTAQKGGSVTIPCFYEKEYKGNVKYLCKGKTRTACTTVARTDSPQSDGNVSITDNPAQLVFTVTLRNLQSTDFAEYWCAVEIGGNGTDLFDSLSLAETEGGQNVWTESGWFSAERGGSVTIPCHYDQKYKDHVKYWCRGFQLASCTTIIRTDSTQRTGNVSITDDPAHYVFNVTMRNLQEGDSFSYWCAVEKFGLDPGAFMNLLVREANEVSTTQQGSLLQPRVTHRVSQLQVCRNPPTQVPSCPVSVSFSSPSILFILLGFLLLLLAVVLVVTVTLWNRHKKIQDNSQDRDERRPTLTPTTETEAEVNYSTLVFKKHSAQMKTPEDREVVYCTVMYRQV